MNYEKLGKYSMILLTTLVIQMIINKKIRHWSFNLLNLSSFLLTSAGISSTMYLLLFKNTTQNALPNVKESGSTINFNGVKTKI